MKIKLGISAGFAVNRFPEPEVWLKIVGQELGLKYVQYVSDLSDPYLPSSIKVRYIEKVKRIAKKYGVKIDTAFTYTRRNQFLHPIKDMREESVSWFKKFVDIAATLGTRGLGSHFGIMSVKDYADVRRRRIILKEGIKCWQKLSEYAKKKGLKFLMFEPMSIGREIGETIKETEEILCEVNRKSSIPIKLCIDVGHGSDKAICKVSSNPYIWLRDLGHLSPIVHIQQTDGVENSRHWPFTEEYNRLGII
jgi:sugar phosphate isomerase/epimerase